MSSSDKQSRLHRLVQLMQFNDSKLFFAHAKVLVPFVGAMLITLSSAWLILTEGYSGDFCATSKPCWLGFLETFAEDFDFPIKTFAAAIAILLVQVAVYRSRQDLTQQKLIRKQLKTVEREVSLLQNSSNFTNYFSHKEEFRKQLEYAANGDRTYDFLTTVRLHAALYPDLPYGRAGLSPQYTHRVQTIAGALLSTAEQLQARTSAPPREQPSTCATTDFLKVLIELANRMEQTREALHFPPGHFGSFLDLSVTSVAPDNTMIKPEQVNITLTQPTSFSTMRTQLEELTLGLKAAYAFQSGFGDNDPNLSKLLYALRDLYAAGKVLSALDSFPDDVQLDCGEAWEPPECNGLLPIEAVESLIKANPMRASHPPQTVPFSLHFE